MTKKALFLYTKMASLIIVLVIVITLLLCSIILKYKITGGEYKKLITDDEYSVEISPSVSQYVLDMEYEKIKTEKNDIFETGDIVDDIPEIKRK